jgi:hypothetical protein
MEGKEMEITIDGRVFDVSARTYNRFEYAITVHEITNGNIRFIGKAITNDIEKAVITMIQ